MATTPQGISKRSYPRGLLRGESAIVGLGFYGMAMVVVFTVVGGWWSRHDGQSYQIEARQQQVRAVGELIAVGGGAFLQSDNLTPLRRMVTQAARAYDLNLCRVVLPDGRVVADSDPSRITATVLPATWLSNVPHAAKDVVVNQSVQVKRRLAVGDRGEAWLEIEAPLYVSASGLGERYAGFAVIGVTAMIAFLLGYRHMRTRLRVQSAIGEALLAVQADDAALDTLTVTPEFGVEAVAWNSLINQVHKLRSGVKLESIREAAAASVRSRSGLDEACDTLSEGLVLIDDKARVRYANGAAGVLLRMSRDDMINASIDETIKQTDICEAIRLAITSRQRTTVETDVEGQTVLRYAIRPVRQTDPGSVLVLIEDITQQRVAEQSRNSFVAQAAHELRTPLTNIRLYVESLLEDDVDEAMRSQSINVINQESKRLERIVSDMLSVSEIEAGSLKVNADDVRLEAVFEELANDYEAQAKDKRIKLTFSLAPKLPVVQADRDKFVVALHNLIGNALKYTPKGGEVDVKVSAEQKVLRIEVRDTGIGIKGEELEKIFDKFYRAQDKRIKGITGTGLGLALAREVMRLHGGDIIVESEIDKGSTFIMELPVQNEAA